MEGGKATPWILWPREERWGAAAAVTDGFICWVCPCCMAFCWWIWYLLGGGIGWGFEVFWAPAPSKAMDELPALGMRLMWLGVCCCWRGCCCVARKCGLGFMDTGGMG